MGGKNWKQRAQERKQWKEITEQAKTHKVVKLKKKNTSCQPFAAAAVPNSVFYLLFNVG
jgi:hypothetical protein